MQPARRRGARQNRDDDARLTDADDTDAMVHCDADEVVALPQRAGDSLHLRFGHAFVGLVLEAHDLMAARMRSRRSGERGDCAGLIRRHLPHGLVQRERRLGEAKRSAGNGGNQSYLVTVRQRRCLAARRCG